MTISNSLDQFAGLPVRDYDAADGIFNVLSRDGHVQGLRQTDLLTALFYAAGPP